MKKLATILAVSGLILAVSGTAQAVDIEMAAVGNPGNAADTVVMTTDGTTGYGAPAYTYNIGNYEVTNPQYAAFLNAVADADPNALYNTDMDAGWNDMDGISRSGSSATYAFCWPMG